MSCRDGIYDTIRYDASAIAAADPSSVALTWPFAEPNTARAALLSSVKGCGGDGGNGGDVDGGGGGGDGGGRGDGDVDGGGGDSSSGGVSGGGGGGLAAAAAVTAVMAAVVASVMAATAMVSAEATAIMAYRRNSGRRPRIAARPVAATSQRRGLRRGGSPTLISRGDSRGDSPSSARHKARS